MKMHEMRDMTLAELNEKKKELLEDLFNLKIRRSLSEIDNPLQIRAMRRDLARVETLMSEFRIEDSQSPAGQE
jgi:large subunit ribosomal protein L29